MRVAQVRTKGGCTVRTMSDNDHPPPFPLTELAQGAAAHHEFYQTYMAAGFSEENAFQILLMVMWYGLLKSG